MKDYVDIICVLDRSGSMETVRSDAIGGFNKFLDDQKSIPGNAKLSVVLFDDRYEVLYENKDLSVAEYLTPETFVPRGWTALYDALGKTIFDTGERLASLNENERPSKVIVAILTDGMENASKDYNKERIADMIKHQREVYNWEFVFLGANIDNFDEVVLSLNMNSNYSAQFSSTGIGTRSAYNTYSGMVKGLRVNS